MWTAKSRSQEVDGQELTPKGTSKEDSQKHSSQKVPKRQPKWNPQEGIPKSRSLTRDPKSRSKKWIPKADNTKLDLQTWIPPKQIPKKCITQSWIQTADSQM